MLKSIWNDCHSEPAFFYIKGGKTYPIHTNRAFFYQIRGKFFLKPKFNFLADVTCVDVFPSEPRFEVIYHLLSHSRKERVRLIAKVPGGDPSIESLMGLWPSSNFFEREIFDLFGVRFLGHPNLRRIMMPEDWEGHPLRKDYPVEGYR